MQDSSPSSLNEILDEIKHKQSINSSLVEDIENILHTNSFVEGVNNSEVNTSSSFVSIQGPLNGRATIMAALALPSLFGASSSGSVRWPSTST